MLQDVDILISIKGKKL